MLRRFSKLSRTITLKSYKTLKAEPSIVTIDTLSNQTSVLKGRQYRIGVKDKLMNTFLPTDYPDSVTKEYLPYTLYSLASLASMSCMFSISTQALFVALGGTTTQGQIAAAAYVWVLKDGLGQLGGILFASRYGSNFDEDIKKWRFMSVLSLNAAIYVEILTLQFPTQFLLLASLGNVGKNISMLLSSASRASINMRFAKQNNMGDISGKAVSQYTTASLLGMGAGMLLTKAIDINNISQLLPTCLALSAVMIGSAYKSATVLDEVYLNNQRAKIIFDHYLKSGEVLSVNKVNFAEGFCLPNCVNTKRCAFIKYGHRDLAQHTDKVLRQLQLSRKFTYLIEWNQFRMQKYFNNQRDYVIQVNLEQSANQNDILSSYHFARLLDLNLQTLGLNDAVNKTEDDFASMDSSVLEGRLIEKGWSLDYIYLEPHKTYRYQVM